MIYLDSSIALAHILAQDRRPPTAFWQQPMTASRLLQYEVWNRLHAYEATAHGHDTARPLLGRIGFVEMTGDVLVRALRPFEPPVRTLDALHLATMDHLRTEGVPTTLASYDARLLRAAEALGFKTLEP